MKKISNTERMQRKLFSSLLIEHGRELTKYIADEITGIEMDKIHEKLVNECIEISNAHAEDETEKDPF